MNGFPGTRNQSHIFILHNTPAEDWPIHKAMLPITAIANVTNAPTSTMSDAVWLRSMPTLFPVPQVGIPFNAQCNKEGKEESVRSGAVGPSSSLATAELM